MLAALAPASLFLFSFSCCSLLPAPSSSSCHSSAWWIISHQVISIIHSLTSSSPIASCWLFCLQCWVRVQASSSHHHYDDYCILRMMINDHTFSFSCSCCAVLSSSSPPPLATMKSITISHSRRRRSTMILLSIRRTILFFLCGY